MKFNRTNECYDYLLGIMDDPETRDRFESELKSDVELANELRECEADLANFAESSIDTEEPSERVWSSITERIDETRHIDFPNNSKGSENRKLWIPISLGVVATLSLIFNYILFSNSSSQSILNQTNAKLVESQATSDKLLANLLAAQDELATLKNELDELQQLKQQDEATIREKETILEELRIREDRLETRIALIERNYLRMIEGYDNSIIPGTTRHSLGWISAGNPNSTNEEMESIQNVFSIWDKVDELLDEPGIAMLAQGASFYTLGPESNLLTNNPQERFSGQSTESTFEQSPSDSLYAIALMNEDAGTAVLSFGNLPTIDNSSALTLWGYDDSSGSFTRLGEIPESIQGASGDIAVRYPEGIESVSEFLVSIEGAGTIPSLPSETIILRAR